MSSDTRKIRPSDAQVCIKHCMNIGRPVFLWGSPGLGKSDIVQSIGDNWNRPVDLAEGMPNPNARPVIDVRLLLMDPSDLKGIPYFDSDTKEMHWAPSCELPKSGTGMDNAILFLDEMNSAPPSVQGAAYQLILNRRVGEYKLPDGVSIIAAGNLESDKGVAYRMPTPLANRFIHLEMESNFDDWQKWALNNNVHPDVVGFLTQHRHRLFTFDPKSNEKSFATPRTWAFASELLGESLPDHMITNLIAGTVGEGNAIEFMAHRRISVKMPSPIDVLTGKVTTTSVTEISAKYSLTISLCYALKDYQKRLENPTDSFDKATWIKYVDNFFEFMMANFEAEMVILGAKTALRDHKLPINHRDLKSFKQFYEKYGRYVLED